MTAQPIDPKTLLDDLHPARFLKVTDLLERWKIQQIAVTISRLAYEETIPKPADIDPDTRKPRIVVQPVLYFLQKPTKGIENISKPPEFPRGMLLSANENIQAMKSATGAHTVGELIGKRVIIFVGEHKRQAVLRISPTTPEE